MSPRAAPDPDRARRRVDGEMAPFACDPVFLGPVRASGRTITGVVGVPMVAFVLVFAAAGIEGNFGMADLVSTIGHDVRRAFNREASKTPPAEFPLLRDLLSLGILCLVSLCFWSLFRQWCVFETFFVNLFKKHKSDGKRQVDYGPRHAAVCKSIRNMNRRFERCGQLGAVVMLVGMALALMVVLGQRGSGVFGTFGPSPKPRGWEAEAYDNWWASVDHPLGFSTYLIVATVIFYFIILQNYVGFEFCILAIRFAKNLEVNADRASGDGVNGWRPLGDLMATVIWSMFLTGLALGMFLLALPRSSLLWIVVPLVVWVAAATLYSATPILLLRPAMRRWRQRYIDEETDRIPNPTTEDRERLYELVEKIQLVSAVPWRLRAVGIIGYLLPIATTIAQFL